MPNCVIVDGGVTRTFLDSDFTTASGSSNTFSMDCGSGGTIVVCAQAAINGSINSVTVDGITATLVATVSRGITTRAKIGVASGVSAGTHNVVITLSGIGQHFAAQLYSILGQGSNTPTTTASDSSSSDPTATLNVPAGGVVIGCAYELSGNSTATAWTGITEDCDNSSTALSTSASGEFPAGNASLTVTADLNNTPSDGIGLWAVWGP